MTSGLGDYSVRNEVSTELLGRLLLCELRCPKDPSFPVHKRVDLCLSAAGEIDADRRNL